MLTVQCNYGRTCPAFETRKGHASQDALHALGRLFQHAATIPKYSYQAFWSCRDMPAVEFAFGRGRRNVDGHLHPPQKPGVCSHPDEDAPGDPVGC